jgi:hypothetical protein
MNKLLVVWLVFSEIVGFSQTIEIEMDVAYVTYSEVHQKAFVAVGPDDASLPSHLLQFDPYTGDVVKFLPLGGEPKKFLFTTDHAHLYMAYFSNPDIDKINVTNFEVTGSVNIGDYDVTDFAVSPVDDDVLFVVQGNGTYPERIVMLIDGVIQPKQIEDFYISASHLGVKADGSRLYGHNGYSSAHQGYLIDVVEDGIVYDGIGWEFMVASGGEIKMHNDLVFGSYGHLADPFTDSIPLMEALMPVYKLTDHGGGFDFSEHHGCYVFSHETDYKGYISFFHGTYYNYLGSLLFLEPVDHIRDVDVVDVNHFILAAWNALYFYSVEGQTQPDKIPAEEGFNEAWFESQELIRLPVRNETPDHTNLE